MSFEGEVQGLVLGQVISRPEPFYEIETEVPADGFLDHFAITLACPGGAYLDGSQYLFIYR